MKDPKFKVRRGWARTSFYTIISIVFMCFGIVLFGDNQTSKNLNEVGIILAPIIVCLTANVSHYMKLVSDADQA